MNPTAKDVALYFWYDADDILLYLGITNDLADRQTNHAKRSAWSVFADRAKVHHFPSREAAEEKERNAIRMQHPVFNREHNDTPEAAQRLVDYLTRKNRLDLLQDYRYKPTAVADGVGIIDPARYQRIVRIGERLVVANVLPGRYLCTARNGKGRRCKLALNMKFSALGSKVTLPNLGEVGVYDLATTYDVGRWLVQRCEHHWPTGRAFTNPEWVDFDPVEHQHLLAGSPTTQPAASAVANA